MDAPPRSPFGLDNHAIVVHGIGEIPSDLADAIDDRIAEILDELLAERIGMRPRRRLLKTFGLFSLVPALAASALLFYGMPIAWTIWASTVTVCLAIAWTTKRR